MKVYRYQGFGLGSGAIGCTNVSGVAGTSIHQLNPSLKEARTKLFRGFSSVTKDGKVIQDYEFKPMNLDDKMPSDGQVQSSEDKLKGLADKISLHSHNFSVGHEFVEQMFMETGTPMAYRRNLDAYNKSASTARAGEYGDQYQSIRGADGSNTVYDNKLGEKFHFEPGVNIKSTLDSIRKVRDMKARYTASQGTQNGLQQQQV